MVEIRTNVCMYLNKKVNEEDLWNIYLKKKRKLFEKAISLSMLLTMLDKEINVFNNSSDKLKTPYTNG